MRFRPRTSRDILGNNTLVDQLKIWLQNWSALFLERRVEPEDLPVPRPQVREKLAERLSSKGVLISGPPGVGKTTAACLCAQECGYRPVVYNASDLRSGEALKEALHNVLFAPSVTELLGRAAGPGRACVIMDECDGMDRGGLPYICRALQSQGLRVPIILVCNDLYAPKLRTLRSRTGDFPFSRPSKNLIGRRLVDVASQAGVALRDAAAELIAERTHNDIRHALYELEIACMRARDRAASRPGLTATISVPDVMALRGTMAELTPFELWARIFNHGAMRNKVLTEPQNTGVVTSRELQRSQAGGEGSARAVDLYNKLINYHLTDASLMTAGIYYNFPEQLGDNLVFHSLVAESISLSDTHLGRMYGSGDWACARDQALLCTVIPSILLANKPPASSSGAFGRRPQFPGQILGLSSTLRSRGAMMNGIAQTFGYQGLVTGGSCAALDAPMFVKIVDATWEAHGPDLAAFYKGKPAQGAEDVESVAEQFSALFGAMGAQEWGDLVDVYPLQLTAARKKASLTATLGLVAYKDVLEEEKKGRGRAQKGPKAGEVGARAPRAGQKR